ncbi:MAG TPA: prepilin-type N-terminal cleavage/methylation domain-containing protein [bacterium]|nr:prepilin-type N-terminal cleavage/methylation domain-containing protein [bacterium]
MKKINIKNNKQAFTLIEIVLILIITSIGLTAILSLASKSINFNNVKKNMFTAMFLSEEGLGLMTNIRDTNMIISNYYNDWDNLGQTATSGSNYYKVDYYSLIATSTTGISETNLWQDEAGFYSHSSTSSSTASIYNRMITVNSFTASSSIESLVEWTGQGNDYDFKLSTVLYDLSFN